MIPKSFGKVIGNVGRTWRDNLAHVMIAKEISPNVLTLVGLLINLAGGALIAFGACVATGWNWWHVAAGGVIFIANAFDILDGAVARTAGRVTKFGAFFDSVLDRYSDMVLFGGAVTYFALRHDVVLVVVSVLAFVGSIMTSYTRARAESLLPGKFDAGYMERPERIVGVIVACVLSRLYMGMIIIAIWGNLTTFQRIWEVWRTSYNLEHPENARARQSLGTSPAILQMLRELIFWSYPRQTWQNDALGVVLFLIILIAPVR